MKYYTELVRNVQAPEKLIEKFNRVLDLLSGLVMSKGCELVTPSVSQEDPNSLMVYWSSSNHYLECEVLLGEECDGEVFYKDLVNKDFWGVDIMVGDGLVFVGPGNKEGMKEQLVNVLMLFVE